MQNKAIPKVKDIPKNQRSWHAVTIMNDVYDRMSKWRERYEAQLGMQLSWTKFFEHLLSEDEKKNREKLLRVEGGRR